MVIERSPIARCRVLSSDTMQCSRSAPPRHACRIPAATEMDGVDPAVAARTLGMSVITSRTVYKRPDEEQQRTALIPGSRSPPAGRIHERRA
jgi:hypothetical protein